MDAVMKDASSIKVFSSCEIFSVRTVIYLFLAEIYLFIFLNPIHGDTIFIKVPKPSAHSVKKGFPPMYVFESNHAEFIFSGDGMLESLLLPIEFERENLLKSPLSLRIVLGSGEVLIPVFLPGESAVFRWEEEDRNTLSFQKLALRQENGRIQEGFHLSLHHEVYHDGILFTDAFFMSDSCQMPPIAELELKCELSTRHFDRLRWNLNYRPGTVDGRLIQTAAPERGLQRGDDRIAEKGILPMAGFNLWSEEDASGPSCYVEVFMEADNTPGPYSAGNESSIRWAGKDPVIRWNFQKHCCTPEIGPWQWRNTWGFVIAPAPRRRSKPPLAMFHYMDTAKRYPDQDTVEAAARAGADVLILHDAWRFDPQNGGEPYDPERFRNMVEYAHSLGLRLMLYLRGNEDSVQEYAASWFPKLLQVNKDGIYMDYGGPYHCITPPNESFQGGRINFLRHYRTLRRIRETVGPEGLFFSHTGPLFSAIGMTGGIVDGYVSGEGEHGLLIRSREEHSLYSMAAVCPGTMWTAAFPEYGQAVMRPFLAATGQSPHVPLGVEFPSSSLAHPPAPGISDVQFRPLWKLWRLLRRERDLSVRCDYNCSGIFPKEEKISHYLMFSAEKAVCIYANFSERSVKVNPFVDWQALGFSTEKALLRLCCPGVSSPGKAVPFDGKTHFLLEAKGVAAICLGDFDFEEYETPYPEHPDSVLRYLEEVETQKRYREGIGEAYDWYLRIRMPDIPLAYEASMVKDLYDNRLELLDSRRGEHLCWLGKNGPMDTLPEPCDFVWNGTESVWFPLRRLLGAGKKELAILSLHRGDRYYINTPFYSFLELDVGKQPGKTDYTVRFMNELEEDRSLLHFTLHFSKERSRT